MQFIVPFFLTNYWFYPLSWTGRSTILVCGGSEAVQLRLCQQEQPVPQLHKQRLRLRLPVKRQQHMLLPELLKWNVFLWILVQMLLKFCNSWQILHRFQIKCMEQILCFMMNYWFVYYLNETLLVMYRKYCMVTQIFFLIWAKWIFLWVYLDRQKKTCFSVRLFLFSVWINTQKN